MQAEYNMFDSVHKFWKPREKLSIVPYGSSNIYSERRKLRKSASFRTLLISLAYNLKVDIKLFCLLILCYKIASQYLNILMSSTLSNNLQKEALTACFCSLVILFCYVHFLCFRTFHYLMCPFRHKNIKLQFNRTRGNFSPFLGKF